MRDIKFLLGMLAAGLAGCADQGPTRVDTNSTAIDGARLSSSVALDGGEAALCCRAGHGWELYKDGKPEREISTEELLARKEDQECRQWQFAVADPQYKTCRNELAELRAEQLKMTHGDDGETTSALLEYTTLLHGFDHLQRPDISTVVAPNKCVAEQKPTYTIFNCG
jgi:hypothetical protein